jgi:UDP-N-acetylmuramoylalanine--D-glutamate ligase
MDRPVWLLAGGISKETDFGELALHAGTRIQGVAVFGQSRDQLGAAFRRQASHVSLAHCETLDQAFDWCVTNSRPGDAILLSPACASFDQFTDFTARGRHFVGLVRALRQGPGGPAQRAGNCYN